MSELKPKRVLLAPLAGYTDLPFRQSCRRHGLKEGYTALIDAGALVFGNRDNDWILRRGEAEAWLGVQLLGSRLDFIEKAVPMLECMEFDEFNFNMGCPVKKVTQRGAGAALLGTRDHALACVRLIRKLVCRRPFTVKLRILSETDPEPTVSFCRELVASGVEGLIIHGRLASKVYSGPVATDVIAAVREAVGVPVTANGGIFTTSDAASLIEKTGCESVMVARGAIGNPWIFESIWSGHDVSPTHRELCDTMEEHIEGMVALYGETEGLVIGRKIIMGYLGGRGYHRTLKLNVCAVKTREEFGELMKAIRDDKDPAETVPSRSASAPHDN